MSMYIFVNLNHLSIYTLHPNFVSFYFTFIAFNKLACFNSKAEGTEYTF